MKWDTLWVNAKIATMTATSTNPYGLIEQGALAVKDGKIAWIDSLQALNKMDKDLSSLAAKVHDVKGALLTPALIDCHTHLVYAGNRSKEFEMRLKGKSYEEIAKAGGGILNTVYATRKASEDTLLEQAVKRASAFLQEGVLTLEIKSGYGLDLETELKILRVAKRLQTLLPIRIVTTFLGAHALPPEYKNDSNAYVKLICEEMIPAVSQENLADFIDVFCESIAFDLEQTREIFAVAQKHNLKIKCHAEQLSNIGASQLAAKFQAQSVDHLEYLDENGIEAISKSGTVAVLLPGAFYYLREKQVPPVQLLRQYKVPMAISTDCNPGTSPTTSMQLMMNMACTFFKLTPEESLYAVTRNAARALGLDGVIGTLEAGKAADFVIWDANDPAELSYYFGVNLVKVVVKNGDSVESCRVD